MRGRRALVTGASRGIGAAIARELAAQGAHVVLAARSADALVRVAEEIRAGGGAAEVVAIDLSEWAAAEALVARATAALGGPVEIACLSHAGMTPVGKVHGLRVEVVDAALATDLRSVFAITGALVPEMMAARFGRIVLVGSVIGRIGQPGSPVNSAIKAALEGLVRNLAADFGRFGITANLVAPGFVDNERQRERTGAADHFDAMARASAIGRLVEPAEVARAAAFLCADGAGAITGSVVAVDGGLHLGHALKSR